MTMERDGAARPRPADSAPASRLRDRRLRGEDPLPLPELPTDASEAALDAITERVAAKVIEAQAEAAKGEGSE
jgi:hypothetical protein